MVGPDHRRRLGSNATAIGANVVVLGIAEHKRQPIRQFTKYGLVVTTATVTISAAYVWLHYFAHA
ncbi:hypothetical protein [Streptomyces longisporoflavus]|uniref:Uncharacterized protein n=1 Tax=Streptomyces longisporoflavus TaxID=28044 RepID=A0ABW7R1M4_9ACTN